MNEELKTFRIANEIQIRWPILTNGEAVTLDGRKISLFLTDPLNKVRKIDRFGTEGNVIVWTFPANEQELTGIYHLTVFENLGGEHQTATDYVKAFRLVARSSEIPSSMQVEELPLASTNIDAGIHGLSAYEIAVNYGYEGSEEQWMRGFDTVLHSTELIVESVATAERVLQRTEQLFNDLSEIQQAELGRVANENSRRNAEDFRVAQEQERQRQEALRIEAETSREQAEANRAEAFQLHEQQRDSQAASGEDERNELYRQAEARRESQTNQFVEGVQQAEQGRIDAESLRVEAETERSQSEGTRKSNETNRQNEEINRASNETQRRAAETRRISNEDERVQHEAIRQRAEQERISNDEVLAESERLRVAAETRRDDAEATRALQERTRQSNESDRQMAEQQRTQRTNEAIAGITNAVNTKTAEYKAQCDEELASIRTQAQAAINEFNRTECVLTMSELNELIANDELVEGCDYKVIEEDIE